MTERVHNLHSAYQYVAQLNFLQGLPREELDYFFLQSPDVLRVVELGPRQQLFDQGDPVRAIYVLLEGSVHQVRIQSDPERGRRATLRTEVTPGGLLGHYDLLYRQSHSTRARAQVPSRLIAIDAALLNRLISRFPRIRDRLVPRERIARLRTIPLLAEADNIAISFLADACQEQQVEPGHRFFSARDNAELFYFIDQGQVQLRWPQGEQYYLGNGMAFGFSSHVSQHPLPFAAIPYGYEAIATAPTRVLAVPRARLMAITDLHPDRAAWSWLDEAERLLRDLRLFHRFSDEQRRILLGFMGAHHFPRNHLIVQQGEMNSSLWILWPGSWARLHAIENGMALEATPVSGPNHFNELALRVDHSAESTVEALPHSQWLQLHRQDFEAFLAQEDPALAEQLWLSERAKQLLGRQQRRARYPWLLGNERLILFERRHWISLFGKIWLGLLLLSISGLLSLLLARFGDTLTAPTWLPTPLALLAVLQLAWGTIDYLNDYLLLTDQRLVLQEKLLWIRETRKAAQLEQIRNVDVHTNLWGALLHYGELKIYTAAAAGSIDFRFAAHPHAIRQAILEQQNRRLSHFRASSKMTIQTILEERLGIQLKLPGRVLPEAPPAHPEEVVPWWRRAWDYLNMGRHLQRIEEDRIIWRKHWLILISQLLLPGSLLLLDILLAMPAAVLPLGPEVRQLLQPLEFVFFLVGVFLLLWIAWIVADWRNDTYEVDRNQIADVEKKPLFFAENRRTALLGEIENIEFDIPSPIHYWLNFGNVRLQTAATEGLFTFDWVPDPRGVVEEIRRRIEEYRERQEQQRARQRAQELPDWFEMYNRVSQESGPPPSDS